MKKRDCAQDCESDWPEELHLSSSFLISVLRGRGVTIFHEYFDEFPPRLIGNYVSLMKALGYRFATPAEVWELYR